MRVKTQGMVGIGIAFLIIGLVIASVGGFTIAFMLKTVLAVAFLVSFQCLSSHVFSSP